MISCRHIQIVILLLTLFVGAAQAETDSSQLRARAHSSPENPVWVGQKTFFYITLSMATRPNGAPRFSLPAVPGGVLVQIAGSPVYGSENINGVSFTTWTYSFAYYPHRAGQHQIPAVSVQASLARTDGSKRQLTAKTEPFTVDSKLPNGAAGLSLLVSTSDLEAKESWRPFQTELRVGEAVTRTITLRAPDVLGMGFPPLPDKAVDGVAAYPKPPVVNDEIYRGDILGERIETVVYVFERQGQVVLPQVVIPWFDLDSQELRQVTFPARRFNVAHNPAYRLDPAETSQPRTAAAPWSIIWPVLAAILALLIGAALLFRRQKAPFRRWQQARRTRIESSEPFLYLRLVTALKNADPFKTIRCARPWLHRIDTSDSNHTLTAFADKFGDVRLQQSIAALMQSTFGPDAAKRPTADHFNGLIQQLESARRRCLQKSKHAQNKLPTLNL